MTDRFLWIAGVDEVGRGALFGPVVAAAVIVPEKELSELADLGVTDSKKLSPAKRRQLYCDIRTRAIACQIGLASAQEIDRLNILRASLIAMRRAILRLQPQPQLCLIDGSQKVPDLPMAQETMVKGDQHSIAIASASIIAKVWRDQLIERLAIKYPGYDLATNKGYGTAKHQSGLLTLGASRHHRKSFKPCQIPVIQYSYPIELFADNVDDNTEER